MRMPLVVNFFGGPGSGKSTMAAHVFAELKWGADETGLKVELVTEYAKDKVWEQSLHTLGNQPYVFGKQLHRLYRVIDKVDIVLTDSPILLSLLYSDEAINFERFVFEKFNSFNNVNIFLNRKKKYIKAGRYQDEEDARAIDARTRQLLERHGIRYHNIDGVKESVPLIIELLEREAIGNDSAFTNTSS